MQDAPDRGTLLAQVAMFLMAQVEPALKAHPKGRGLAFRTRIAAHLIATVGRELLYEEQHDAAELARLQALLADDGAEGAVWGEARREAIAALRAELASSLRDDECPVDEPAVRKALMETLREQLAVVQPRFDTRAEWPGDDAIDGIRRMPSDGMSPDGADVTDETDETDETEAGGPR